MTKSFYANRTNYRLVTETDGWVSIYEINAGLPPKPLIQACNMEKAEEYCIMREPVPPGVRPLVER